jgi:phenylpyruvate tautomerase PptA (4-oxalocrotonate tautomerase family)
MHCINVQVSREGVTAQQQRDIIAGVTRLMQDVPVSLGSVTGNFF